MNYAANKGKPLKTWPINQSSPHSYLKFFVVSLQLVLLFQLYLYQKPVSGENLNLRTCCHLFLKRSADYNSSSCISSLPKPYKMPVEIHVRTDSDHPPPYSKAESSFTEHRPKPSAPAPKLHHRRTFISVFHWLIAIAVVILAVLCIFKSSHYCPYYTPCWLGGIYLIQAFVTTSTSCCPNRKWSLIGQLIICTVTLLTSIVAIILSCYNWYLIGQTVTHGAGTWEKNCIIGGYYIDKLKYIIQSQKEYDFGNCLMEMKIGISVLAAIIVLGITEIVITIVSGIKISYKKGD